MPRIDPYSFLDALVTHLASALSLPFAADQRSLWAGPADEGQVPKDEQGRVGVYTEFRAYDGSISYSGLPTVAIQARTVGHAEADARGRAAAVANALLDAGGRPARRLELAGFRLLGVLNLRGPAYTSRDEAGRGEYVVNFDASYVAT